MEEKTYSQLAQEDFIKQAISVGFTQEQAEFLYKLKFSASMGFGF